jgi:drug/metabolite transporter (DMT)-like permease
MSFEVSRLRRGEWIVGAGSVVLLASILLLPWFGHKHAHNGWNGLRNSHWLLVVTLILALALVFFQATRRAPGVPSALSAFVAIFGTVTAGWLVYRVGIAPPSGRKAGGWLALVGALAIAYGGFSSLRREGIAPKDAPAVIPTIDPRPDGRS